MASDQTKSSREKSIPPNVLSRGVADEEVLLDLSSQIYYGLNPVGSLVWRLLKKGLPPAQIIAAVVSEFEVAPQQARRDVDAFIERLESKGLLRAAR